MAIEYLTWVIGLVSLYGLLVTVFAIRLAYKMRHKRQLSVTIDLGLSQEAPVLLTALSTNTLFNISSPIEGMLRIRVKLKLWVGYNRVPYSGGGLYDGTKEWEIPRGLFRGVVNPGSFLIDVLRNDINPTIDLKTFLTLNKSELPEPFQVDLPERLRARLCVSYKDPVDGTTKEASSSMYYLQPTKRIS